LPKLNLLFISWNTSNNNKIKVNGKGSKILKFRFKVSTFIIVMLAVNNYCQHLNKFNYRPLLQQIIQKHTNRVCSILLAQPILLLSFKY